MMANAVDPTIPQNSESPTRGAQRIRETKAGFNSILEVEHDISDDATTKGFHGTNVTGKVDTSIATPPSGYGRFGWKTISGVAELFYRDDAGNETQLTSGGEINLDAVLLTGNQTVAGDKTFTGTTTLKDESTMASSAAPTADAQIANKKYVDDGGAKAVDGTPTQILTKYFTGTLDNDDTTNVAHGISSALTKILHLSCSVFETGPNEAFSGEVFQSAVANQGVRWGWDATNVIFSNVGSSAQGNRYTVKIDYIL